MLSFPNFGYKSSPGSYKPGTWEASGKTPVGNQPWSMRCTNCRDLEDNDTSRVLTIGEDSSEDKNEKKLPQLIFTESCDQGRDWRSDIVYIEAKNPENGGKRFQVKHSDEAGRSGETSNKMDLEQKEEVKKMIHLFAAMEGMTATQFVSVLPAPFTHLAKRVIEI